MKRSLWLLLALVSLSVAASAQDAKDIGVGLVLGDTLGATGKLWLDKFSAIDLNIGADSSHSNFTVSGDYLFHGWKALPQPSQGRLAAYIGGGPRIEAREPSTEFGLKAILGAAYYFPKNPIEIYGELGPLFRMTPDGGVYLVGSVGIRFYFKNWN